jgi:hydantoinase/carbamoylase family amidase
MQGGLRGDFDALCAIGRDALGGWSRLAFGEADCAAHDWFLQRGREVGLSSRYDAFGNAILRLDGENRKSIVLASHLDTVQRGGAYDGAIGVLVGLEVARRLAQQNHRGRQIEVIAFRDEEGRFGPFVGSRAMAGTLTLDVVEKLRAVDGTLLTDALQAAGFDHRAGENAKRDWSNVAAYLEIHIEQGPVLEAAKVRLGIVTAIAGQERLSVRFLGRSDHAGTAPMQLRRDAFAAAAQFAVRFRELILSNGSEGLRGTIGIVNVSPNQGNVVPGEVRLGLEIRDIDGENVGRAMRATALLADEIGEHFGCSVKRRMTYQDAPVPMDASLREVLRRAAAKQGVPAIDLPSGANHDAGIIGRIVPAAMLFVPSQGGRSHCPEEFTEWDDIELAANVLESAVKELSRQ